MNQVLMIAFHYPPFRGGSGIHRTLKFSCYLPDYGWQPIILSAHPRAYPQVGDDQLCEIPKTIKVARVFALDTARHLSIRGSFLRWMALPDRWVSWWLGAIPAGLHLIKKYRPQVIWSTYPIATAHLIGFTLHRLTGIPWVADFRDPMTEDDYPRDALTHHSYLWIEKKAVKYSSHLIFTTESTRKMYLKRYSWLCSEQCLLISNGYDEEDFKHLITPKPTSDLHERPIRLLHAGLIYPEERDPRPFFSALSALKNAGVVNSNNLSIALRATGSESYYSSIIHRLGINDIVQLLPALPYRQTLQNCTDVDALLLFQGVSCNHQTPAKAYEYLRLQKPILALTDEKGDTAALLRENGGATIIDMADEQAIYLGLPQFLNSIREGKHPLPDNEKIQRYSRRSQTGEFAAYLSQLIEREKAGSDI